MKIVGLLSGHDCSYCVLENGIPIVHNELERFIREKEPPGDALEFFFKHNDIKDIDYFISGDFQSDRSNWKVPENSKNYSDAISMIGDDSKFYQIGHHQSHAANAFYSSNFDEALIITIDGGGGAFVYDEGDIKKPDNFDFTSFTVWRGEGNKIYPLQIISHEAINIGSMWRRVTVEVFGLSGGHPYGNQAGTVMAMATNGNREEYSDVFYGALRNIIQEDKYWDSKPKLREKLKYITSIMSSEEKKFKSEQESFDIAAGLQDATERLVKEILTELLKEFDYKNICLSGGVALNCVMTTKIYDWFDSVENVFIDPVPYDGGLSIGSARYLWHHILDNPRIEWKDNASSYLGKSYDKNEILTELEKHNGKITFKEVDDNDVLDLIGNQKIISVFGGGSESGRRALGNRSILCDPRGSDMKDIINEKVKHRQWFRPFAPSILREDVSDWFEKDLDSPYMSFAVKFKKEVADKVPAVVHFDDTGRLQTVTENDNGWYYNFIKKWKSKTEVPILLNTSFNDREPIVETPEHAVNCFLGTNIDGLYFYDINVLVEKVTK